MKKILLVLLTLVICNPSFANDWFPQVPSQSKPEVENTPTVPNELKPKEQTQQMSLLLRAPCATFVEMTNTIKKYKEELLFSGTGLTFSAQTGQPYNGGMFFFTNQDTGSWTLLQAFGDGMACMIMNGRNFQPYVGDQPYGEQK